MQSWTSVLISKKELKEAFFFFWVNKEAFNYHAEHACILELIILDTNNLDYWDIRYKISVTYLSQACDYSPHT